MPDEYGTFGPAHLNELRELYGRYKNITFAYSPNHLDCYIININGAFETHGTIPFGGNPRGRTWVSVYGRGANHFSLCSNTFPGYIQEKLKVDELCAESISKIFKALSDENTRNDHQA